MTTLFTRRLLVQSTLVAAVLAAAVAAIRQSPTAREVVWQAFTNLFGFFSTPFILEATVAVLGLIAVISYNQWRISRDGDGWVVLPDSTDQPPPPAPDTTDRSPAPGNPSA